MGSMLFTSGKTTKPDHSFTQAATTLASVSSQVVEWYLLWIEGLHLECSVSGWSDKRH